MRKIFTLLSFVFFVATLFAQNWNISTEAFNALGKVEEKKVVEGLSIYGSTSGAIEVDANNKTLDEVAYTHRLKFGGTGAWNEDGTPNYRVISFDVTGDATITVIGMSSSSSADRELIVAAGNKDTELGRFPALGASISKGVYTYKGGATTIYLFSPSSGVNLYHLKAESGGTSVVQFGNEAKVVKTEFFNLSGARVSSQFEVLPNGVYIKRLTLDNGKIKTTKLVKASR